MCERHCALGLPASSRWQRQRRRRCSAALIYGTVHDSSGAVLPGALVQLTSEVVAPREAAAGGRGDYRFPGSRSGPLHAARHARWVCAAGARRCDRRVGASVEIRIDMVVAAVTEEVVITATSAGARRRDGRATSPTSIA